MGGFKLKLKGAKTARIFGKAPSEDATKGLVWFGQGAPKTKAEPDSLVLGAKGARLLDMSRAGIPVPPGFILPTEISRQYEAAPKATILWLKKLLMAGYKQLAAICDIEDPLVSVRSGAPVSMPGMMDTVLNVGLTSATYKRWSDRIGVWATLDCWRRLISMYGTTVHPIAGARFAEALAAVCAKAGVTDAADLDEEGMENAVNAIDEVFCSETGGEWPDTIEEQLVGAAEGVLFSWSNERANVFRAANGIESSIGTAITVQAMVFGTVGDVCGSGVFFTRNPSTGDDEIVGEFRTRSQGEDVVSGCNAVRPLHEMTALGEPWASVSVDIQHMACLLEDRYADAQDVEFTVEDGRLWVLQSRDAKRTAEAAVRIGAAFLAEGVIKREEALRRVPISLLMDVCQAPLTQIVSSRKSKPLVSGLGACPGTGIGVPVFSSKDARDLARQGQAVILVRPDTSPDDIDGMLMASGVITEIGGITSHAAVVARALNKPCIVGAEGAVQALAGQQTISMDGQLGFVFGGKMKLAETKLLPELSRFVEWYYEGRGLLPALEDVLCSTQVVLMARWPSEPRRAARGFAAIDGMEDRSGLVFDLTEQPPGKLSNQESWLWTLPGAEASRVLAPGIDELLTQLMQKMYGCKIILPDGLSHRGDEAGVAGYRVVRLASSLADFLEHGTIYGVTDALLQKRALGSPEAAMKIIELLRKGGAPAEILPPYRSLAQLMEGEQ